MLKRFALLAAFSLLALACQAADPARAPSSAPAADSATATGTSAAASARPGSAPRFATQEARVVRVADGDTIEVEIGGAQERVRYIGIDAPELGGDRTVAEPFGSEAREANRRLVEGRTVYLEKDVSETDQFGRLLRYAWLRDGGNWLLVNAELVREGMAESHHYPIDQMYIDVLDAAEAEARAAHRGIWSNTQ